jgi:hypothetical protein
MSNRWIIFCLLLLQAGACLSADAINLVLLPDSFNSFKCHQPGVEFQVSQTSTLAVFGRLDCESERSTYGDTNDEVTNTFSRIFVPWRYSKGGAFRDGPFMQSLVGMERSRFKSVSGSTADVTYVDFAFHYGYQWFWNNGFNVSVIGGLALLVKTSSDEEIVQNENNEVIDFLDKNTRTNVHPGAGFIFGWKF